MTHGEIINVFAFHYGWAFKRIVNLTLDQVKRLWLQLDLTTLDDRMFSIALHHGSKSKAYKQMDRSRKKLVSKIQGTKRRKTIAPTAEKSLMAMAMSGHRVVLENKSAGQVEDITNRNLFIRKR